MNKMRSHHSRRDDASLFDSKEYYQITNPTAPKYSLSCSVNGQGILNVTDFGSFSSENWQFFFQSGRYFIRNYDYGAKYQLGLEESNKLVPKLYLKSGSINQQWIINRVDNGFEMINGLLGPGTTFGLPLGATLPSMRNDVNGAAWNITSNPSAAKTKPISGDLLKDLTDFQVVTPTPSATPSAASSSVPTSASDAVATIITSPSSTNAASPSSSATIAQPSSSSLAPGAIAGIVIGSIAGLAFVAFALWFFLIRRKRSSAHNNPYEVHGDPAIPGSTKYAHRAELAHPPAELPANEKEVVVNRVELESSSSDQPLQSPK